MTSYEIVKRAIEFERPERLPFQIWSLDLNDTYPAGVGTPADWEPRAPGADEWGCIWEQPPADSGITNMGQPTGHPLRSLDDLDTIPWPDPYDESRYAHLDEVLSHAGEKYVVTGCGFGFFERMHFLYGMPNLFIAMHEEPQRVHELAERAVSYPIAIAREFGRRFRGRVHGFCSTDDWGTQQSCFIQMPMWREFFKERYRRYFTAVHEAGMHVWLHSCGHVNDVIEEWIDCGVDVLNLQQPRNLGIEEIGRRYRGRVCFSSSCDIQTTLPFGTEEEIRQEARLLLEHWASPDGGFILSDYGDGNAIGASAEAGHIMIDEFIRLAAPGVTIPEPKQ